LLFSVLLRPNARFEDLPQVTLLAAVAMVDALEANGVSGAQVKWPNDILIDGRKVCGILAETGASADGSVFVVLGVGLNVNEMPSDFPPELREIATSLAATTGRPVSRQRIFHAFLDTLAVWLARWRVDGFAPIRDAWCARSCTLGRRVQFVVGDEALTGEAADLGADGSLAIRDQNGTMHSFYSGEMRFLAEPSFEPSHKRSVS
jgi:BirA family biotin operon repressor/biotin-[acetyl-CoA-carboxylase] ligase